MGRMAAEVRVTMDEEGGQTQMLERVWCAEDRSAAMSTAKRNEPIEPCADGGTAQATVQRHRNIGDQIGINSTPAFLLPDRSCTCEGGGNRERWRMNYAG